MDLLLGAVVLGVLLGCFYAAVSVGCRFRSDCSTFPTSRILLSWCSPPNGVYLLNDSYDIDPLLAGLAITPLFFVFGFSPTASITRLSRSAAATRASAVSRSSSASPSSSSADHPSLRRRPAFGYGDLYRQVVADRRVRIPIRQLVAFAVRWR